MLWYKELSPTIPYKKWKLQIRRSSKFALLKHWRIKKHFNCSTIPKKQLKTSVKYSGTRKVLQFTPKPVHSGCRCKVLRQDPTTGAPSKFGGGPSLGRKKLSSRIKIKKPASNHGLRGYKRPQNSERKSNIKVVPKKSSSPNSAAASSNLRKRLLTN